MTESELDLLRERVKEYLKPTRVPHVLGCEQEARSLAALWGENVQTAAEAALLHDITKRCSPEEHYAICCEYALKVDSALLKNAALLHALTGAALAKSRFGCSDEVCSAIRWHTTGKPAMTRLEKIIYLADFSEPTRSFPGVEALRRECRLSLDSAMALALGMSVNEIRSRGIEPYRDTLDAFEYYLKITKGA